ncbi:glutamate 5-kinase [Halarchaeum sp. CBA1220]|uniref:glutamate 5-kinase n=1 Tax=Halarchaeum sp. CBA1220 TaxID=1853682 RepID=UPI000F3A9DD7|nr:glutamate 5-kinase [Halarchaeum sp. CBA1220]QLC34302.1 glutamate 5-kinase [Halarchaeum sp. CBA1220]
MSEARNADAAERARRRAAEAERVVVKAGTNSLTDAESNLDDDKLDTLVDDIAALRARGKEVLLVSSGAVGAGLGMMALEEDRETVEETQALSTIGQGRLMHRYTESFARYDTQVAQLLLTQHDLEDPERYTNLQNTIETLFEWGVVPIVNENDAVATEEVRIGDNDMLSSSLAVGIDVDLLVTLTDVGGVYTGNPKRDGDAERIAAVGENYDEVSDLVDETASGAFGGIQTKVEGARKVAEHGSPAIIAASEAPDVLERVSEAEPVGTIFLPVDGVDDE